MKILELKYFGEAAENIPPVVTLTTDSSAVRDNRPVFLPELSEHWRCDFMPAYIINHLGKSISERFAPRYYDKMTIAARFIPLDIMPSNDDIQAPATAWATAFDGAIALGRPVEAATAVCAVIKSPCDLTTGTIYPEIDRAISLLSSAMTLKTGDIIIPPSILHSCDIAIGDHVEVATGGETVLSFNVK